MTKRKLERMVSDLQKTLRITAWDVRLNFEERSSEGADATIYRMDSYDTATIRLNPLWRKWSEQHSRQTLAHELLHLVTRDLEQACSSVETVVGSKAFSVYEDRIRHEMEGVVDRLSKVITS